MVTETKDGKQVQGEFCAAASGRPSRSLDKAEDGPKARCAVFHVP